MGDFICLHRVGTLCTVSHSHEGFPFGSIAPYDVDESGRIIVFISRIAEHFKNLTADPRASLFVADRFGSGDPQAYGRATLLATFAPVPEGEFARVAEHYFTRFPAAPGRGGISGLGDVCVRGGPGARFGSGPGGSSH